LRVTRLATAGQWDGLVEETFPAAISRHRWPLESFPTALDSCRADESLSDHFSKDLTSINTPFFTRSLTSLCESFLGGLMSHQRTASKLELEGVNDGSNLWSDDECVRRLAALIELRDNRNLGEIARLIGRLAVAIE
jgi:hypothetical protein